MWSISWWWFQYMRSFISIVMQIWFNVHDFVYLYFLLINGVSASAIVSILFRDGFGFCLASCWHMLYALTFAIASILLRLIVAHVLTLYYYSYSRHSCYYNFNPYLHVLFRVRCCATYLHALSAVVASVYLFLLLIAPIIIWILHMHHALSYNQFEESHRGSSSS